MNTKTNFELKREIMLNILKKYKDKNIKISALAKILKLSTKQTRRMKLEYNQTGTIKLEHKSKYMQSKKSIDCNLFIDKYKECTNAINASRNDTSYRLTFTDFYLSCNEIQDHCCQRTMTTKFHQSLIYSPKSKRKTKREINKKIKELNNPKVKDEIKKINQYDVFKEIRPYKGKDYAFGEIVELDACQHRWINGNKYFVYHAVDTQTSMILASHVELQETTIGYYKLIYKLLMNYGCPQLIKTDKRKSFWGSECTQTLLAQTLNTLNIELICDSSPTFKPNVERSFDTAQHFYPFYAYQNKITSIEEFAKRIDEFAIASNHRYKKEPIQNSVFENITQKEIDNYICPKQKAKITNGLFVTFHGKCLAPVNGKNQRMILKEGSYLNIHLDLHTHELFTMISNVRHKLIEVSSDLIFEETFEVIHREKEKLEKEKIRNIAINTSIRKNLDEKEARIDAKIKYLKSLSRTTDNCDIV